MLTPILSQFDELVEKGIQVIPLWHNTKVPMCKGWTNWDKDASRETLQRWPEANIGILLGKVIDVEGDSRAANDKILSLIGNYPHPSYNSTKSIHHLFLNPDPKLNILKHRDIEFRAHKHQSVLPPSHHQGVHYQWTDVCEFPIPEMPESLYQFYKTIKKAKRRKVIKPGHIMVRCGKCAKKNFVHKKRFELELSVFKKLGDKWQCRYCRELDLRPICRVNRKYNKGD